MVVKYGGTSNHRMTTIIQRETHQLYRYTIYGPSNMANTYLNENDADGYPVLMVDDYAHDNAKTHTQ